MKHLEKTNFKIAYICPNLIGDYYQTQWMALHQWAKANSVSVLMFSPYLHYIIPELAERYRHIFKLAQAAELDGIIVNDASLHVFFDEAEIQELFDGFGTIPLISLSATYNNFPSVIADNEIGLRSLMNHLLTQHNYKKFGFIQGIEGNKEAELRFRVFQEALSEKNIAIDENFIAQGNFVYESGRLAAHKICENPENLPEVIVCANDEMALGAIEGLKELNLRVPQDIAVTGFDDTEAGMRNEPGLTTITQEIVSQVFLAMERLVCALRDKKEKVSDNAISALPTSITIRGSCGCPQNSLGPISSRDNDFLQKSQYLVSNRGCEIGEIANFSKTIMGALSLSGLKKELLKLCRVLKLTTLKVCLYIYQTSKIQVLFDLSDSHNNQTTYPSNEYMKKLGEKSQENETLAINEMVFDQTFYGFIIAGREDPEPLVFNMINLELTNCLYTIFLKNRMDAANEKLRDFDTLKNEFIANIAHDFRSPLSIILGTSELALFDKKPLSEELDNFEIIKAASLKIKNIIDRFLELSRMDEKGVSLNLEYIDLEKFLHKFSDFYRSSLLHTSIDFQLDLPKGPLPKFKSDSEKIDQILSNLVSNALKFVDSELGRIILRLEVFEDKVKIIVEDNGIGIPTDKLEAIFERFTQLVDSKNLKTRGTGIGLAFSRSLSEHLGGNLYAESEGMGKGSRFTLILPQNR